MAKQHISFSLNGQQVDALVEPRELLVHTIRETLNLTGTHIGCETSHCGVCTVDLDDGRRVDDDHDRRRHDHHHDHRDQGLVRPAPRRHRSAVLRLGPRRRDRRGDRTARRADV